ncbi:GEVED domain-containing protein [uncultured Winogradskyella sp.]|uniref:GEVED domain-containing protein n=1 Tax=uncultured Winogradskyella sp. TaxID=395353 RepID=UPI00260A6739|nr:GEVED domain-containing protein [uncultured Winogradskyella sp.]
MIKKYSLSLLAFLCLFLSGYGQGSETFTNLNAPGGGYGNGSYTGDNGVNWTYNRARSVTGTYNITGRSIGFADSGTRNVSAISNVNGVGDLTYSIRSYFTGGSAANRSVEVYVNGTLYDSYTLVAMGTVYTRPVTVNETGAVLIEFRSVGSRQIIIDDISWTTAVVTDPDLSISGTTNHGSSCLSTAATTLQYTITNSGIIPAAGVNVTSNDPQFVVSGLSSTSIAASGTATFDVTFTPTAVGAQTSTITVTSTTPTSNSPTIALTGTGISVPTLTQPTNQNEVIPATATFDVTSADATSYQWQVSTDGGTTWNNVTGGSGATTDSYTTTTTSAGMNGNLYRCILTNACGSTTSNSASLSLTNSSPSNAQNLEGCFEDTSVVLTWNNPATPPTGGYIIFAIEGTTDPTAPPNDANTYTANPNYNAAPFETPATLGKVVYKGNGTTATITGLTEDLTYSFRIFAYNGESLTGWSNGTSGGSNEEGIAQGDVRNLVATPLTNQVTLNWLNPTPTSCWDEILIVANQGPVVFTPTGDGSAYTANPVYSGPNQVVHKAGGNTRAVTGLTNGLNYCFRAYIRRGTSWTTGVEVCAVPSLTYCNAEGNTSFDTGITGVNFNTINNTGTPAGNSYTDYTSISTNVIIGDNYNLGVEINIDGGIDVYTRVWIDWNQDGNFNGTGEEYDLGMDTNPSSTVDLNIATSNSPINIEIPTNAAIGATRMRVATKYNAYPTSCETGYSGEVEDYTIFIQQPVTAEMNVKGNNISIADGFNAPYGLNNTLFASTNVGATTAPKSYYVENLGATPLNLIGAPRVELIGAHPGDFNITLQPSASIGSLADSEFRIEFSPTSDGIRTATVRILNSDSDENPYEFDIEGTAVCTTILTSTIWPTEGPENTEVTITSVTDLTAATATINGLPMTVVSSSVTELVVLVPAGAIDANIVVEFSTGCSSNNTFNIIDDVISGCDTATSSTVPTDLFISEISDATSGSSSLIEIFNGTASNVDLTDYSIRVFNNGSGVPSTTANLTGTLASGATHVISVGTTTCDLTGNGLSGGLPNQTFNSAGGINFDNNSSDAIELYNSVTATSIDVFGVLGSSTWANSLGIGNDGVNYRRQNTATPLPSTTFDLTQWDEIDWTSCGDSDYSDFGVYDFSLGIPPSVSVLNPPALDCTNAIQLSVVGTEGVPAGLALAYQWYYLAPSTTTFVAVPNNADFNNVTTATLDILNPIAYDDYQFYCQVRENSTTCYQASNAIKISGLTSVWDGVSSTWSAPPTIGRYAIIDGNYNTSAGGTQISFSACGLVVNSGFGLDIQNGDYIEIENDIVANGDITVFPQGSVVQNNDLATVSGTGTMTVQKQTSILNTPHDYTYWSSPVAGETVENVFSTVLPTRRFIFNAANFVDMLIETNNTGTFTPGQDDIDDDGNDWQPASGTMMPGVGYAATPSTVGPALPVAQQFPFVGPFNNGVVTPPIVYVSGSAYKDWNFIGNPYPSAIDTNVFFTVNSGITDAIYLWSQATPADVNASGNEGYNFSGADYAVISASGVNTAGGDISLIPNDYVPSGQGFFIEALSSGSITFNNSMRVTSNNDQFFRNVTTSNRNVLWLNLTSDNGVANQLAVAHLEGATDGNDGSFYDVKRNISTQKYAKIYSTIDNSDSEYVIQGKNPNSLDLNEVIEIGFNTFIESPTIYTISIAQFEGAFYSDNIIYLRDNLLNIVHNLKDSNYNFTSETGVFNSRFEIVFAPSLLSIDDNLADTNDLTITELLNGDVQFKIGKKLTISNVVILDVLGREIYTLQGSNSTEVYDLSKLSNAAYIAQVTLSNGQLISKKAIKQR